MSLNYFSTMSEENWGHCKNQQSFKKMNYKMFNVTYFKFSGKPTAYVTLMRAVISWKLFLPLWELLYIGTNYQWKASSWDLDEDRIWTIPWSYIFSQWRANENHSIFLKPLYLLEVISGLILPDVVTKSQKQTSLETGHERFCLFFM